MERLINKVLVIVLGMILFSINYVGEGGDGEKYIVYSVVKNKIGVYDENSQKITILDSIEPPENDFFILKNIYGEDYFLKLYNDISNEVYEIDKRDFKGLKELPISSISNNKAILKNYKILWNPILGHKDISFQGNIYEGELIKKGLEEVYLLDTLKKGEQVVKKDREYGYIKDNEYYKIVDTYLENGFFEKDELLFLTTNRLKNKILFVSKYYNLNTIKNNDTRYWVYNLETRTLEVIRGINGESGIYIIDFKD